MNRNEIAEYEEVTTRRFDIPSIVFTHQVPESHADRLIAKTTRPKPDVEFARSTNPKEFEITLLVKGVRGWHGTFTGMATHFAIINRSYEKMTFAVSNAAGLLFEVELESGNAVINKVPEKSPTGFSVRGNVSTEWCTPARGGNDPAFFDRKLSYVEPGDYVRVWSLGPGYSLQARGAHPYKLDCEGLSFRSNTSKLEMPAFIQPSQDWGTSVCAAAIYEATEKNHPHCPQDYLSPEVVEEVHGCLPKFDKPELMNSITFIWIMTLIHCMGGRAVSAKKKANGRVVFKAILLSGLIAYVTAQACTTNSQCIVPGRSCIFGVCSPKSFDGGSCDDSADCWVDCGCQPTNPPRGSCLRCGASVTPTSTVSASATRTQSSAPSPSGSMTKLPSATGSTSASRTGVVPSSSSSMTLLPSASITATLTASETQGPTSTSTKTSSNTPISTPTGSMTVLPSASLTSVPTGSGTPFATADPTTSNTPAGTPLPTGSQTGTVTPSGTAAPSPSAPQENPSVSATMSAAPTFSGTSNTVSPSLTLSATAAAHASMLAGHFEHNQARDLVPSSSAAVRGGVVIALLNAMVNAATCIGTRLARTSAEIQASGATYNSTEGNYTYDSTRKYGIEEPTQVGIYCPDNYSPPLELEIAEHNSRSLKELVVSTSPVFIYLDNNVITLRFLDAQPREVEVNAMGLYWNAATESATYYLALPNEIFYKTTSIVVRTRLNGLPESESAFTVEGRMPCIVQDCWVCNLSEWDCIPKVMKAVLVIFVILCCIVIIWAMCQCGATLLAICSVGGNCSLYLTRALWGTVSKRGAAMADWVKTNGARDAGRSMVIAMMICGVACCDYSFTMSSSSMSKVVYSDHTEYELAVNTEVTMKGPGTTSCILFSDGEQMVAQLTIRQSSSLIVCDLVNPYYTSAFSLYALSSFRCNGAGPCPGSCDEVAPRDAYGEFNSTNWIDYPGETRCTRRCQGIACGCILPASGCVYTTYSILPEKPTAKVSEVSVCNRQPSFLYELVDGEGTTISTGEIDTLSEVGEDDEVSLEILSQSYPNLPQDFPTHLVQTKAESILINSARRGYPKQGMVGDIQADTNAELNSGDFIYDPRIVMRIDEKNKHDKVVSSRPGIEELAGKLVLPAVIGRSVWATNADPNHWATKIQSYDPSAENVIIGLRTKGNHTISTIRNVVCPEVTYISSEGCRECTAGAKATFRVRSRCLQGSLLVSGPGVVERFVLFTTVETDEVVVFRSDEESYEGTWRFGELEVKVKADLQVGFELDQQTLLYNGTDKDSASKTFRLGEWKWWEYTLFSIVLAVALAGVVALLVLVTIPSIKAAMMARKLVTHKKTDGAAPQKIEMEKEGVRPSVDDARERLRRMLSK